MFQNTVVSIKTPFFWTSDSLQNMKSRETMNTNSTHISKSLGDENDQCIKFVGDIVKQAWDSSLHIWLHKGVSLKRTETISQRS